MRIPDGDLVPARKHRYGGGYGRRRRSHRSRLLVAVVAVLLVGTAGAWFLNRQSPSTPQTLSSCPTPRPTPSVAVLPSARQVRLVLLNGTPRNGLAATVAAELTRRGFVVVRQDNAPAGLAGPSVVTYPPGGEGAAVLLSRHILGARTMLAPKAPAGVEQVVLGADFRRLATPAEVAAADSTRPSPSPTGAVVGNPASASCGA